jgi:hypothetical protein
MQEIQPIVYKIELWALGRLNELINKYNKRAAKLQLVPIKFNFETKIEMRPLVGEVKFLEVTFEGNPLRIDGWEFRGTVQHAETGNILRAVPGREIPELYRTQKPRCEHCKTSRQRKDTFVLVKESGESMMVGRNCLRDFLGHDPDMQLRLLDMIWSLSEESEEGRGGWQMAVPVIEMLNMTAAVALHIGFAKGVPYTAWQYLFPSPDFRKMVQKGEAPDIRTSKESLELAERAMNWIKNAPESNFISNVKAACNLSMITYREANLCGWAIGAYLKEMEQDKMRQIQISERQKARDALSGSQHFGEIGKRMDASLKLIMKRNIGTTEMGQALHLYKFVTSEGNVATWITTNSLSVGDDYFPARVTVKAFKEFEGIKETTVNRLTAV